jgi:hypothetical protein
MNQEDLWRSFPTTATEFEAMFPDEEACRRYLVEVRWGGRPRCGKCDHDRVWELTNGDGSSADSAVTKPASPQERFCTRPGSPSECGFAPSGR